MYEPFEKEIGYSFQKKEYLRIALTHSSYANEHRELSSNERLEFLGDSVLGMIVSDNLFRLFPDLPEGDLSKMKAALVREESLAALSARLHIDDFILLGKGEEKSGGSRKNSILADCFEALLGAIYLDGGIIAATNWLNSILPTTQYSSPQKQVKDYKTKLQEFVQESPGCKLRYKLDQQFGAAHNKTFVMSAIVNDVVVGTGRGSSKKIAEQEAAKDALQHLMR